MFWKVLDPEHMYLAEAAHVFTPRVVAKVMPKKTSKVPHKQIKCRVLRM